VRDGRRVAADGDYGLPYININITISHELVIIKWMIDSK
jgi:hypothetical protein